ncbi:hypothetical protein V6N12_054631 [Hibiscus sabdariffa]|uniref:Uncharacterized protein n=1 Tax=Hibiscus sabdariffa TaxID=183260 RepID=A0ABR2D103_9ROSI
MLVARNLGDTELLVAYARVKMELGNCIEVGVGPRKRIARMTGNGNNGGSLLFGNGDTKQVQVYQQHSILQGYVKLLCTAV